jgi:hypothetical protein
MSNFSGEMSFTTMVIVLVLTALSLTVSLAWNEGIKSLINEYYPQSKDNTRGKVIYALVITALAMGVVYLTAMYAPRAVEKAL